MPDERTEKAAVYVAWSTFKNAIDVFLLLLQHPFFSRGEDGFADIRKHCGLIAIGYRPAGNPKSNRIHGPGE